jgi:hypothetical protein
MADGAAAPPAAQDGSPQDDKPAALDFSTPDTNVEMKPTEIGVRFTPEIAGAIAKQMARGMRHQYELDDDQTARAQEVFHKNLMKLAHKTQSTGRDAIELMMANMIANDGSFTKADGQRWAGMTRKVMPDIKEFMTTSAAQIGKTMTISQRLKLTAEMAGVSAGVVAFESRLKRWEQGDLPDMANPFMEMDEEEEKKAAQQSGESAEVTRARRRAEQRLEWETNVEHRWTEYVESAIKFFEMNESQEASARAILAESLERARQIRSDDWIARMKRNRTSAGMARRLPDTISEVRGRIDGIVETPQREKAMTKVRDEMKRMGYEMPPA